MHEVIETKASAKRVWSEWEKAHVIHGQKDLSSGCISKTAAKNGKKITYQIQDVVPGKSFSILWKSFLVRLIFTHSVSATQRGAEIRYGFQIRGPFALPVRWMLAKKIRKNLSLVLKTFVHELEKM